MDFIASVEAFGTQLQANQRSRHALRFNLKYLGMPRDWLEREFHPLVVERITPPLMLESAASKACTHQADGSPRELSSVDKIKMSARAFFGFLFEAAQ